MLKACEEADDAIGKAIDILEKEEKEPTGMNHEIHLKKAKEWISASRGWCGAAEKSFAIK